MIRKKILFVLIILFCSTRAFTEERLVAELRDTDTTGTVYEGSLRDVLQESCRRPGDDTITFNPPTIGPIAINLTSPLVIPKDCQGRIHIKGHSERETILQGSHISGGGSVEGDSCILNIYSNTNTVEGITFLGNESGAGICVFGRENRIFQNRFNVDRRGSSEPNRYGVVLSNHFASEHPGMDGGANQIIQNVIERGSLHGIFSQADSNIMETNRIESPREMGIVQLGDGAQILRNIISHLGVGRMGIMAQGNHLNLDGNQISQSPSSGIRLEGSDSTVSNSHIEDSSEDGIATLGNNNQFISNTILHPRWAGIAFRGNDFTFKGNIITHSEANGIAGQGNNSHIIENNQIQASRLNAIGLEGNDNEIFDNTIAQSYRHGLFLEGERFTVSGNNIRSNAMSGIYIRSVDSHILKNRILANGGCPVGQRLASQSIECFDGNGSGGSGIHILEGSRNITIGGESFERDKNIIQYNRDGGVIILGDATSEHHKVTHNTISRNYGLEPDLDLLGDGITWNDPGDLDEGPNHLLNTIDYLQVFPLVNSPTGEARYWSWGLAQSGNRVELYGVPEEDRGRGRTHGGGETFYGESPIVRRNIRIPPHSSFNSFDDQWVTALSFTDPGDTSEYATNVMAGRDQDLDGIVDSRETGNGTPASGGSSPTSTDSDGDGLPDSVEDANHNGRWDPELGETSAYNADSDGDGLSDWVETHGDGHYDPGIDTDPLNPDTDGDGLRDGEEDTNGNGIWESYLGESSPLIPDSDNDGIIDSRDNCRSIFNPGQEPWMCGR